MQQVLFRIPPWSDNGLPIYGFGFMMVVALYASVILAGHRAQKEGIPKETLWDLAIWLFVFGIVGARITFMIQYREQFSSIWEFFQIWKGGLVFYGSAIGGVVGYFLGHHFVFRKRGVSSWQLADIVAPSVALGLCIGRFGCLLNGCCFGNVACAQCPAIHFPVSSPAFQALHMQLVRAGSETVAGFLMSEHAADPHTVGVVQPGSPAAQAGLQTGDVIVKVDDIPPNGRAERTLASLLGKDTPRGKKGVYLTVERDGQETALPPLRPRSIGLHPTQIYESITMLLVFLLLIAFYPFRPRIGSVMVVLMLTYAVHRFLNEMLRNDTDPVRFDMTLSQNGSVLVLLAGLAMGLWLWRKGVRPQPTPAVA